MYWDIVEVAPKADSSLFVRFKDGLEGLVRLRREQLTGALEPLLDERFFEQVFIADGRRLARRNRSGAGCNVRRGLEEARGPNSPHFVWAIPSITNRQTLESAHSDLHWC